MMNNESVFDYALHNFPVVQCAHIFVVTISLPPVLIFIAQISKIALHDNCRFLMRAWSCSFLACLIVHCAYIGCDFITGKYIPVTNHDPPIRLILFSVHGFAHVMSSAQELLLSLERAVSCARPAAYHTTGLARRFLLVAESLAVLIAFAYLWLCSRDDVIAASLITNSIDFASLICLSTTTYFVIKINKNMMHSSLNEKYQIKEALAITRVMLPCGVTSLVMKFSSTLAAWIYALEVIDSSYMFTITGGAYFILASLNCAICCTIVLRRHSGLRRLTGQLLCPQRMREVRDQQSAEIVRDIYFEALKRDWQ